MENQIDKFGKYLTVILTEMCSRVGVKLHDVDWENPEWYWLYEWTSTEQDDFQKWLTEYMYANKDARNELSTISTKSKKHCNQFASQFIWNYGWKCTDDKK